MDESNLDIKTIAIVAGGGDLPPVVVRSIEEKNVKFVIVCFDGVPSKLTNHENTVLAKFEEIFELFNILSAKGVDSVAFCGYVLRPKLNFGLISQHSKTILEPLISKFNKSDEHLFTAIIDTFKSQNFKPISLKQLIPNAFCEEGILTAMSPSDREIIDTGRAEEIFQLISGADLGQSLVVSDGLCLAVESAPGTDLMLEYLTNIRKQDKFSWNRGILYKAPKINQNSYIDSPVIGEKTLLAVKEAGLAGIVVKSESVIIVNRSPTIDLADKLGLFLWSKK